jgi:hypothetical protein
LTAGRIEENDGVMVLNAQVGTQIREFLPEQSVTGVPGGLSAI